MDPLGQHVPFRQHCSSLESHTFSSEQHQETLFSFVHRISFSKHENFSSAQMLFVMESVKKHIKNRSNIFFISSLYRLYMAIRTASCSSVFTNTIEEIFHGARSAGLIDALHFFSTTIDTNRASVLISRQVLAGYVTI